MCIKDVSYLDDKCVVSKKYVSKVYLRSIGKKCVKNNKNIYWMLFGYISENITCLLVYILNSKVSKLHTQHLSLLMKSSAQFPNQSLQLVNQFSLKTNYDFFFSLNFSLNSKQNNLTQSLNQWKYSSITRTQLTNPPTQCQVKAMIIVC